MTGLVFLIICIFVVLIIILWSKVTKQEEELQSIKHEISKILNELNKGTTSSVDTSKIEEIVPSSYINYNKQTEKITDQQIPVTDIYSPETTSTKKSGAMESWFGRNVLGIVASILVFIGLIFLGTLLYEHITETIKIIAMFVISALVTGLGITLMTKKRNNFTEILVGCGCGCFFLSILLTHIYFNRITDITAFSLLLVWMAAILYLSKILRSTLLSVVAHIGMIISICFAFGLGITDNKLVFLLIYQGVSIAVILLGNILCCKKTYHFGVFISLLLTIVASCFMWNRFTSNVFQDDSFPFASTLPTIGIAIAFTAQFLCASFLSYLLSISTNRLKNESYKMIIHVANKTLWFAALVMNVYHITYRIAISFETYSVLKLTAKYQLNAVFVAVMVTIAVLIIHAAITLILSLKLNFNSNLETFSVMFLSVAASVFMIILWSYQIDVITAIPRISFLFIISLLLLIAKHISRNKAYQVGANVILALDFLFMLFDGYHNLSNFGTIALSIVYMLFYIVIIWEQWYLQNDDIKAKSSSLVRLSLFVLVEASLISIFVTSNLQYSTPILLLILTALNILLYLFRYDRSLDENSVLAKSMIANEYILLLFDAFFIAFVNKNMTLTILYLLLSALAFGLAFCRIHKVFDGSNVFSAGILTGIKLTVLVLVTVYGHTSWFDQAYGFSIWGMLIALVCIVLGFKGRVKSLRLYGLVMTLVFVLKLVTYDVANLNTPLRVFSLIFGGVICFIISAMYNYTTKKIENESVPKQ